MDREELMAQQASGYFLKAVNFLGYNRRFLGEGGFGLNAINSHLF